MKQNEIAVIILVIAISLVASFIVGGSFISNDENRIKEVEMVEPIPQELTEIDTDIFNQSAVNPSENINVSESDSEQLFPGSQ